ncbi:MAG TPA: helix-turn-helix domain-containing protein [Candidatus Acidoferrales bacterium]
MSAISAVRTISPANEPCRSQKKRFATEQEAVGFEAKGRATYGGIRQHAYLCEDCGSYHLSCLSPDARNVTDYKRIENGRPAAAFEKRRRVTDDDVRQMVALRKQGLDNTQIAERLNFSDTTVSKHLKRQAEAPKFQQPTVDSLSSEEKHLEAKLNRVREEKQRLIELNAVKVARLVDDQVSIRRGLQSILLTVDDALDVTIKLTEVLGLSNQQGHDASAQVNRQ